MIKNVFDLGHMKFSTETTKYQISNVFPQDVSYFLRFDPLIWNLNIGD